MKKHPSICLWFMFFCWLFPTVLSFALEAPKTAQDVVNPIYVMSVIIAVLFLISTYFLNKWIRNLEADVRAVKESNEEICIKVTKLKTEHDLIKDDCEAYLRRKK